MTGIADLTDAQKRALEIQLRSTPWKVLVKSLKVNVEKRHEVLAPPAILLRWLELEWRRRMSLNPTEAAEATQEAQALLAWAKDPENKDESSGWFEDKVETFPISGWVINLSHILRDGRRWWILMARRHDDRAPLVGETIPASASPSDLKKLAKIVAYAGGDPKRELLRTGAITHDEREALLAAGQHEIAAYGQIFYWWRA
jgi:hypothetical protein